MVNLKLIKDRLKRDTWEIIELKEVFLSVVQTKMQLPALPRFASRACSVIDNEPERASGEVFQRSVIMRVPDLFIEASWISIAW